jgi:hypothetical protein
MRNIPTLLALAVSTSLYAQTVVTVQNGAWSDPATWDCSCVPAPGNSLVIMHSVQILGDLTFSFPQVQVTTTGEITMSFPGTVQLGGTFIIEGHVILIGTITNVGGTIDVPGFFEVVGVFTNDGDLIMDGGLMQVEGDFINTLGVSGDGGICVYDSTDNQGTITGTVDICDATPTTAVPPIVDANSGTIAGTVTYCQGGLCGWSGIGGVGLGALPVLYPVPSSGVVWIKGLPAIDLELTVRDAIGRATHRLRTLGAEQVPLPLLPDGPFTVEVRGHQRTLVLAGLVSSAASR